MLNNKKTLFWLILSSFLLIPLIVSVISSIHVINFFEISNNKALAIALSVSFEIGALSALAGLVVLDKINKNVIYFIFFLLTAYQMMGNTYFAYDVISEKMMTNPNLISNWSELFGFETDDIISMKRLIAIISGAILPIVSLCFLDLSVDYIKKSNVNNLTDNKEKNSSEEETKKKTLVEIPSSGQEIYIDIPTEIEEKKQSDETISEDFLIENIEEPKEDPVENMVYENKKDELNDGENEIIEPIVEIDNVDMNETPSNDNGSENENLSDDKNTNKRRNTIVMKPRTSIHNVSYYKQ